jgi:hypothetical protein
MFVVQSTWQLEVVEAPTSTLVIASVAGGGFPLFPAMKPAQPAKPEVAISKANKKAPER